MKKKIMKKEKMKEEIIENLKRELQQFTGLFFSVNAIPQDSEYGFLAGYLKAMENVSKFGIDSHIKGDVSE